MIFGMIAMLYGCATTQNSASNAPSSAQSTGTAAATVTAKSHLQCSPQDRSDAHSEAAMKSSLQDIVQCADQGDLVAQNELGRRYGTGTGGVALDSVKSFNLYQKAALAGYTMAKANLGYMYFSGEGTTQDYSLAYKWCEQAAIEGSAQAQYTIGYMHATGTGAEKNGVLAEKWLLAAANQGDLDAQHALIHLYSAGDLVPRDVVKATLWTHRTRDAVLSGKIWRKDAE
jgi:TPR repeat protein